MTSAIGFDNDKYLMTQKEKILERIAQFDNKLYLEFGGKLFDDYHASRVLPGFDFNAKTKLLQTLKDKSEVIFCISADDIQKNKIRADYGISYDTDVLRLIDLLREAEIYVSSVVITLYNGQPAADIFKNKLERVGEKVYIHTFTKGYPTDVETIVSDEGYGANPYIETTRPLVVVTAPGPGSGKLATCLSQLYHDNKRGIKAGYAKFETFPIWNLPLKHPVNIAYEAATADLKDVNLIDPFHLEAYGISSVNYNRDIECFPVLRTIIKKICGQDYYKSPTDMGVNMAGYCITDDELVREAACQEVIRRYYRCCCDYKKGLTGKETAQRVELLMNELGIKCEDRAVVIPALEKTKKEGGKNVMAIQLKDGRIITGKRTQLMHSAASLILNALKALAGIADDILLLSPVVIEPIMKLKKNNLNTYSAKLNVDEVLIALSICATTNPVADRAIRKLPELAGCDAHSSYMLNESDQETLRRLKIQLTSEPVFLNGYLYQL